MSAATLSIQNMSLELPRRPGQPGRPLSPVQELSLDVSPGELHALVGESGSGKSLTCRSILRLGPPGMRISAGSVHVNKVNIASLSRTRLRRFRGGTVGMIFQNPAGSLSPAKRAGAQIAETLRVHEGCSRAQAMKRAREVAERVGLTPASEILRRYPHELSGGMAQRVAIAAAVACHPRLLIADEPTTALDATVQRSVLELIDELRRDLDLAVLFVSHDLAVVERYADSLTVMYCGRAVEQGESEELFRRPRHPYTQALLRARPQLDEDASQQVEPLVIPGAAPRLGSEPSGCPFHTRCPAAREICQKERPVLVPYPSGVMAACHVAAQKAGLPDFSGAGNA